MNHKKDKWVLDQMKLDLSLKAKMTKLRVLYFGHIRRRQESLEKATTLGKAKGGKKS